MSSATQSLFSFHPGVQRWFDSRFEGPTAPQEKGWAAIQAGEHALIAAPTGSGKTLAAFLAALDRLFKDAINGELGDETRVLYVSPLKALSNDIHRNLMGPLEEIQAQMDALGYGTPKVTAALRTGDTSATERRRIVNQPPNILVTTPESLYLLLTSESGRGVLETVETLIVDEIHALAPNRRGAHLALSVERLAHLVGQNSIALQRIGLSATQRPMRDVASFLVGTEAHDAEGQPQCRIIDEGHLKNLDLGLILPDSPLEAVMAHEVWDEIYKMLVGLIEQHRTTLIFVNTRRLAERMGYHLVGHLGEGEVMSHHGSLSLDTRRLAETRLKHGQLKAMVATSSMELGIDIGSVDLVCQIGSPRSISALVQRIGRSGHHYGGVPKGRIFPLTRDELIECTALLHAVDAGQLDRLRMTPQPLDVLSQQMVASLACEEWDAHELYELFKKAWLYRDLSLESFMDVAHMLADGITTKRGRRGAWLYYDGVNDRLKARKGARLTAVTNAGAIPDNADYRVVEEPKGTFVGSVNEDFAVESLPGHIFRLGNHSWRILKIENGTVRVEDAQGAPPNIPFWFGEAPSRSGELSDAISELRGQFDNRMDDRNGSDWLSQSDQLPPEAVEQLSNYLAAARKALGALPTREHIIIERFFDETGGMQMVIHAPFGSRLNRAWGLALRKRFCRSFNFELQAAATEDAIVLSLGPRHAFPLEEVFDFLHPNSAERVLVQALLDAPMFATYWRWTASRALALLRRRGGRHIPPNIQRMEAEDLIAVVFPDQLACLENIAGDREVPDHPLIRQTLHDCLHEFMDLDGLIELLGKIQSGDIKCTAIDLPEPSPLAHEVLNAQPYAFLDDAPLEERRTQAVYLRRTLDEKTIREKGLLDADAIAEVRDQAWPDVENPDELHDALLLLGAVPDKQMPPNWREHLPVLLEEKRVGLLTGEGFRLYITAERLPQWRVLQPEAQLDPTLTPPPREAAQSWELETAALEIIRGLLEASGPVSSAWVADWFGLSLDVVESALLALENEGMILRGHFDEALDGLQWCNRRLLARIHHLTLHRLRERIKPVSAHVFMRFLFKWHHLTEDRKAREAEGLENIVHLLEGFEAAAGSWETDLLPARTKAYQKSWLDRLCLEGRVSWARISQNTSSRGGPIKTSRISLYPRQNTDIWLIGSQKEAKLSGYCQQVVEVLEQRGALFFAEILTAANLLHSQLEDTLTELAGMGMVTCDSFAGLRALLTPANKRPNPSRRARMRRLNMPGIEYAGRWSLLPSQFDSEISADRLEYHAMVLLRRYGVVFRKIVQREPGAPPWRDLLSVYRHLEAIGEIRGGRFVAGFAGEQFALPEATSPLRDAREEEPDQTLMSLCGADPLNLTGLIVPGHWVPRTASNRILFRDALPIAALDGGKLVKWRDDEPLTDHELEKKLSQTVAPDKPFRMRPLLK